MPGRGGTKISRWAAALLIGGIAAAAVPACSYEDDVDAEPTAAAPSYRPAHTIAAGDPDVLAAIARNYVELERRLGTVPGSVLLADSGPADGPGVGFQKVATLPNAGEYTVVAACVGLPGVQFALSQNMPGSTQHTVLEVDCSGAQTQVVELHEGHLNAQLVARRDPAGAATGAVAGIRITAP
ncbi:hypothetical protein [Arthrobacter sp. B3I4]|uniref:hypothetical protein n=1 Tax=Arthrobacter sp. B3I4 TaxID=3042267 RepID=UPI00277E11EC|nr:hypothetical protein [Arthrobacter sp. B3I4]MDQ0754702.1 hypothetical protein [Arthrobacter sp. B3I4]